MKYVEAPTNFQGSQRSIFLAGGITDCPDWQADAATLLSTHPIVVLNPRRRNFPIGDPDASEEQVRWEYQHLHRASVILFWFPANGEGVQPIALYELGHYSAKGCRLAVGAAPGYNRRADVFIQLSLARPELTLYSTLGQTCNAAIQALPVASVG